MFKLSSAIFENFKSSILWQGVAVDGRRRVTCDILVMAVYIKMAFHEFSVETVWVNLS